MGAKRAVGSYPTHRIHEYIARIRNSFNVHTYLRTTFVRTYVHRYRHDRKIGSFESSRESGFFKEYLCSFELSTEDKKREIAISLQSQLDASTNVDSFSYDENA